MSIIRLIDSAYWFLFLILLIAVPLPFGAYDPFYWSLFGAIASILICVVFLTKIFDKQADYSGLYTARYVLMFLLMQILYVAWQITTEGTFFQSASLGHDLSSPNWFISASSLSADSYAGVAWLARSIFVFIIFILALTLITTRKRIRWAIYTIIASAVFHAVIGLLAKFSSIHLVAEQSLDGHFNVSRGLFVNRNHYAAMVNYGLAMLSVGGFYAVYLKGSVASSLRHQILRVLDVILSRKLVWLCAVVISLVCLSLSTSRAAMLGLVGSFSIIVILAAIFDRQFRLSAKWLFLIAISVVGIIFLNGADGILSRLEEGFLSIGERREQWRVTWQIIQQYWLFGTGAGTYSDVFQYYREFGGLRQTVYDQSHSVFLQTLMEQGVIGFCLWLASIIAMFWCLFLGFRSTGSRYMRSVILGVGIAILMALLQSLVDFNLLLPALNVYFYCLLAIGIAACTVYSPAKNSKPLKKQSQT